MPQVFPTFGVNTGNFLFSGPGEDEDFGREERTGDSADRYKFRTAPLRNLAVSPGLLPQRRVRRISTTPFGFI